MLKRKVIWLIVFLLAGIIPILSPNSTQAAINWGTVDRDPDTREFAQLLFSVSSPGTAQVFFRTEQLIIYPGPGYGQNAVFTTDDLRAKGFYGGRAGTQTISFSAAEIAQKAGITEAQVRNVADNSGFTLGAVLGIYNGSNRIAEITRADQVDVVCGPDHPTCGYTFPLSSRDDMRSRWGVAYDPQKPEPRILTVQIQGHGTTTPAGSAIPGTDYESPANPTGLVAYPATGWRFSHWLDVNNGLQITTSPNTSINTSTSRTVRAVFIEDNSTPPPVGQFALTMKIEGQGTTTPSGSTGGTTHTYNRGSSVDCYAVADDGWHFVKWKETNETEKHIVVRMTSNQTRTAVFEQNAGDYSAVWLYGVTDGSNYDFIGDYVDPSTNITRSGTVKQDGYSVGDLAYFSAFNRPEPEILYKGRRASIEEYPQSITITAFTGDHRNPTRPINHSYIWYRWIDPPPPTGSISFYYTDRATGTQIRSADVSANLDVGTTRTSTAPASIIYGGNRYNLEPAMVNPQTLTVTLGSLNPSTVFYYTNAGPFTGYNLTTHLAYEPEAACWLSWYHTPTLQGPDYQDAYLPPWIITPPAENTVGGLTGNYPISATPQEGDFRFGRWYSQNGSIMEPPNADTTVYMTSCDIDVTATYYYHKQMNVKISRADKNLLDLPDGINISAFNVNLNQTSNANLQWKEAIYRNCKDSIFGERSSALDLYRTTNSPYIARVQLPAGWRIKEALLSKWDPVAIKYVVESKPVSGYLYKDILDYATRIWITIEPGNPPAHTLTMQVEGSGTTSPAVGVHPGLMATADVSATPSAGWVFDHWEGDGVAELTNPNTFVDMSVDRVVKAVFVPLRYTLTVNTAGTGSGTVSPIGNSQHAPGTSVTVTAVANADSYFAGFIGDLNGTVTPQNIIMDRNKTVVAVFNKKPVLTLQSMSIQNGKGAAIAAPGGTPPGPSGSNRVEPPVNPAKVNSNIIGVYNSNQQVTLTAEPVNNGSFFVEWREGNNVISTDLTTKIRMTGDRTITAVFNKNPIFIPAVPPKIHVYIVK